MKLNFKIASSALLALLIFTGCNDRESSVASYNISREADSFQIKRRIVFFNGITGKNIMEIIGYCSVNADTSDNQLEVTCKVGQNMYKKHYFGLSNNTAYFVEQVDPAFASEYNYKVVFRPQTLIPDVTVRVSKRVAPMPKVETVKAQ